MQGQNARVGWKQSHQPNQHSQHPHRNKEDMEPRISRCPPSPVPARAEPREPRANELSKKRLPYNNNLAARAERSRAARKEGRVPLVERGECQRPLLCAEEKTPTRSPSAPPPPPPPSPLREEHRSSLARYLSRRASNTNRRAPDPTPRAVLSCARPSAPKPAAKHFRKPQPTPKLRSCSPRTGTLIPEPQTLIPSPKKSRRLT